MEIGRDSATLNSPSQGAEKDVIAHLTLLFSCQMCSRSWFSVNKPLLSLFLVCRDLVSRRAESQWAGRWWVLSALCAAKRRL